MRFIARERIGGHNPPPMAEIDPESDEAVSQRCRLLREVVQPTFNQRQFAAWLGVGYQRWNNVENGMPLSRDLEGVLRRKIAGLTPEYLREGDMTRLNLELAQRLLEAEEKAKIG